MSYTSKTSKAIQLDEKQYVEVPFLEHLADLGWTIVEKEKAGEWRSAAKEVLLDVELRKKIKELNDWMQPEQVEKAMRDLRIDYTSSLIDANEQILNLLLKGTRVQKNRQEEDSKNRTVKYIDFSDEGITSNSFVAITQYRLEVPGRETPRYPDIVLFINGIPVVVVECKSDKLQDPMGDAIDQLNMYSNQGRYEGEGLGNPELFYYNQFTIATCQREAKFASISATDEKYFYRWMNPHPYELKDIRRSKTQSAPTNQERLVQGMLSKKNLLSIIQTFTIFTANDKGRKVKIVGRYQQFKAVKKVVDRLLTKNDPKQRGGIIWHTQGSGKSLTMMFIVREMWNYDKLQNFKIVFVTDRTDLEKQLTGTSQSIGYTVHVAASIATLRSLLKANTSDLVMAMIQKFQPNDVEKLKAEVDDTEEVKDEEVEVIFPELNPDPNILVMIDEAHRSQYKVLGASLKKALPNATYIAFTGTPIEKTSNTFGDLIDEYTMKDAVADGVTLEIVYEGRTEKTSVTDKKAMDAKFIDVFQDYTPEQCLKILGFSTREAYLEAQPTIDAKAKDMVDHFVNHIFRNGFKAQVVAVSRLACARYKTAIDKALQEKIALLEDHNPDKIDVATLKKLKTGVIVSGKHKDKKELEQYTKTREHDLLIADFKLPFNSEKGKGNTGILIVNNMLLTGFDAPVEQVLYLDRTINNHNLLQAIARVNRVADEKTCGFVVDYVGLGHHLVDALNDYKEEEIKKVLTGFKDSTVNMDGLRHAHKKLMELVNSYGVDDLNDLNAFFDLFYDEKLRFGYLDAFKEFANYLDRVLPNPAALDYVEDFKKLSLVNAKAAEHTRDERFNKALITEKLRAIADEYLKSKGVFGKVEPISIMADSFDESVGYAKTKESKAKEIIHAVRHEIDVNIEMDPVLYASYSEALEAILQEFANNWEMIYQKLEELRKKMKKQKTEEPNYGLDRKKQMPFFRVMKKELFDGAVPSEEQISVMVNNVQHLTDMIKTELTFNEFWSNPMAQNKLKGMIQDFILTREFRKEEDGKCVLDKTLIFNKRPKLVSDFMQLAFNLRKIL